MEANQYIVLIDDEPRYRNLVLELLRPVLPNGWCILAPEHMDEMWSLIELLNESIKITLIDCNIGGHGYQGSHEGPVLKGYNVAYILTDKYPNIHRVGFTKGGVITMRNCTEVCFSHKQVMPDLTSEGDQSRVLFVHFITNLINSSVKTSE